VVIAFAVVTGEAGLTTGAMFIGPLEGRSQAICMPGAMYIDLAAASCVKTSISKPFSNAKRLRAGTIVSFRQACMTLGKDPVSVNKGWEAGSNDASTL
jgi:hypothetical protein